MMYDLNTKNLSFLRMSKALRNHGVKNNKFMLWLYDDSLSGVDPYSPDLTFDEKARIYAEICKNFWYYLREVCMIPSQGSAECVHFKLNLGNLAMSYCNINNINSITMLPRQQGKTIAEVSFSNWVHMFATYHTTETYLHKAQDGATDNLKQFKAIKEALPAWLQELVCSKNDKDNLEEKYFYTRKNQIRALASASTDEAADKMGRGSSTPLVYMDEFAFMARNKIIAPQIQRRLLRHWVRMQKIRHLLRVKKENVPVERRRVRMKMHLQTGRTRRCWNNGHLERFCRQAKDDHE